jgi:hypothetical protein
MLSATKGSYVRYFPDTFHNVKWLTCDVCCMTSHWTMHVTPVSVTTSTFLSASYEVHVLILLVLFNET